MITCNRASCRQPIVYAFVNIFFKFIHPICHLFSFSFSYGQNSFWLCSIFPSSKSCPLFSVFSLSCFFSSLLCYTSYSLFLSLWVLLHGSHFLLRRCSSFLAYVSFPCTPCTGYISLSLPLESNFSLPSMCFLFILWHSSVNTYKLEWYKKASKNMAISSLFFLILLQLNLLWPFFLSFLSQAAVSSILLHCVSNYPHLKQILQLHPICFCWSQWFNSSLAKGLVQVNILTRTCTKTIVNRFLEVTLYCIILNAFKMNTVCKGDIHFW